jgi:hypothetical protein
MSTNPISERETPVATPNRNPLGKPPSTVQPKQTHCKSGKAKLTKQATPQGVPPKPETEFRLSGSPELPLLPTQDPAVFPPERQPKKLISPEEFRSQYEAPLKTMVPKLEHWAGLVEEDRTKEWAALWQKDKFAALTVIAPAIAGAKHMYDVLQVYCPMILKFRDELRINGRPSKERAQWTWQSIGIDSPGTICWESACKVIWKATPQYVNQCIRQGGRTARQLTDGNPNGGGTVKRRGGKGGSKGSSESTATPTLTVSAATAVTIQTPRELFEAIDGSETFKDALENVFMVNSKQDFVTRVQEFAQLLADSFRPRGYRVVVEVELEKERMGTGRTVPPSPENVRGLEPTPPAAGGDSSNGGFPVPDPETALQADPKEPVSEPGAEPPIPEGSGGGKPEADGADGEEPAPCPRSKKVYEAFRGGPKVLEVTIPAERGDAPRMKYYVCNGDQIHPHLALDEAKAACDRIAGETPGCGARKRPASPKPALPAQPGS